ncbi:unnamed protein product [Paramecium octaurelia]|uniref:Iron hydrogenase large subunit C-terminal domain-containing protein n=2 Tax=Paramecium octaurelia TaxID=43137 RepID=A0A8S1TLU2_PAROT|nr:unnamed protein product [Paramecium octaurelia]
MFSSTIKISSVSDYIVPSQECIKPLIKNVKLQLDDPSIQLKPNLIKNQNNVAKVSLQDCLACSGCVTTAETILIQTQSLEEFLQAIKKYQNPAIGISPQARASLSYVLNYSDSEMHSILHEIFQEMNVKLYDLAEYTKIAINNSIKEFKETNLTPLLCSECPGWVCYAEKTLDESIINHMSKVKSPQQIFGALQKKNHDYIATIMPCYDKKLEAVRQENNEDINIVLSTREIEQFVKDYIQKANIIPQQVQLQTMAIYDQEYHNTSSNNYLDYIIKSGMMPNWTVKQNIRKNKDFIEITIYNENMESQGIYARVFGLKNIANLVSQIKTKTCKYKYVEIMACPLGCLNGGGQIQIQKNTEKANDLIPKLKEIMTSQKVQMDNQYQNEQEMYLTQFKHVKNENNFQW